MNIDYDAINRIVYDNKLFITGGYVRSLIRNNDFVDDDWGDLDILEANVIDKPSVSESLAEAAPGRFIEFHNYSPLVGFYHSAWVFDGKQLLQHAHHGTAFSPTDVLDQIKNRQAVIMHEAMLQLHKFVFPIRKYIRQNLLVCTEDMKPFNLVWLGSYFVEIMNRVRNGSPFVSSTEKFLFENTVTAIQNRTYSEQVTTPTTPTLGKQLKTFASSMGSWAKSGFSIVSNDKYEERLAICNGCEFIKRGGSLSPDRCGKCGCVLRAKARLATDNCPIGKW